MIRYDRARKLIRDGDIFTVKGKWFVSRLICWWTGQSVSHVAIAIWMKYDSEEHHRLCAFQAMEGRGVQIVPVSTLLKTGTVYWQRIIDPTINRKKLLGFILKHWDEDYTCWYQFVIGMSPTIRFIRKIIGRPLTLENWHCSKIAICGFIHAGYMGHKKEAGLTTPGDIQLLTCLGEPNEILYNTTKHDNYIGLKD